MRTSIELDKWLAPILLPAAAALLAFSFSSPAQAGNLQAKNGTYVIPADGSYGIGECISQSFDCGSVVATAWCEAHGHGAARAFGPASDATFLTLVGSTENVKAVSPSSIIIDCEE
jgi:hypothetical protein